MTEIWKDIPEFIGIYQISNLGRIKSLFRETKNGVGFRSVSERIKKTHIGKNGYLGVTLKNKRLGLHKRLYIHRLVAEAFIPNPLNKKEVNHKDSNRSNPNIENLEWVTPSENQKHSYDTTGRQGYFKGKISPSAKPVIAIQETSIIEFHAFTECAKYFGVCLNTAINYCRSGKELKGHLIFML